MGSGNPSREAGGRGFLRLPRASLYTPPPNVIRPSCLQLVPPVPAPAWEFRPLGTAEIRGETGIREYS